jgi:ribosomal protein S3
MDRGYSVAVKKLGTIGCSVAIMKPDAVLPHEITVYAKGEAPLMDSENTEVVEVESEETIVEAEA